MGDLAAFLQVLKVGDIVEIIRGNSIEPMPGGLVIGSRGTVVGDADDFFVCVDYGLADTVHSMRDSIRKVPPPPREQLSTWDDVIVWRPAQVTA